MVDIEQYFWVMGTWEELDNGLISVTGNLALQSQIPRLPFQFSSVSGTLQVSASGLTTLDGCPSFVGGSFVASFNHFKDLEGGPRVVQGDYSVARCENLKSLDGLADEIGGQFSVNYRPDLPLLRSLVATRVDFTPQNLNTWELTQKMRTAQEILNRYAGQGEAGAFACGAELASAGLKDNARW